MHHWYQSMIFNGFPTVGHEVSRFTCSCTESTSRKLGNWTVPVPKLNMTETKCRYRKTLICLIHPVSQQLWAGSPTMLVASSQRWSRSAMWPHCLGHCNKTTEKWWIIGSCPVARWNMMKCCSLAPHFNPVISSRIFENFHASKRVATRKGRRFGTEPFTPFNCHLCRSYSE